MNGRPAGMTFYLLTPDVSLKDCTARIDEALPTCEIVAAVQGETDQEAAVPTS